MRHIAPFLRFPGTSGVEVKRIWAVQQKAVSSRAILSKL